MKETYDSELFYQETPFGCPDRLKNDDPVCNAFKKLAAIYHLYGISNRKIVGSFVLKSA